MHGRLLCRQLFIFVEPLIQHAQRCFACKVLVGKYCQGWQDQPTHNVRKGTVTDLYDSVVDDVKKPEISVIYHDTRTYPEYRVKFKLQ